MSWHGRWGKPDPFKVPVIAGDVFGTWRVVREVRGDYFGSRAICQCVQCGRTRTHYMAQLRYAAKHSQLKRHRGCRP